MKTATTDGPEKGGRIGRWLDGLSDARLSAYMLLLALAAAVALLAVDRRIVPAY